MILLVVVLLGCTSWLVLTQLLHVTQILDLPLVVRDLFLQLVYLLSQVVDLYAVERGSCFERRARGCLLLQVKRQLGLAVHLAPPMYASIAS